MTDSTLVFEFIFIALTFLVMLVGLVGAVLPILPGASLMWVTALGYGLAQPLFGQPLFNGWVGGVAMVFLTLLTIVDLGLEFAVTHTVAHKEGVSFRAILASIVLGLVGLPFFPPIGPLVGSVLGLFLVEYFRHGKDARKAWKSVGSYAKGCGWSVVAELGLCVVMLGVWGMWVTVALAFRP